MNSCLTKKLLLVFCFVTFLTSGCLSTPAQETDLTTNEVQLEQLKEALKDLDGIQKDFKKTSKAARAFSKQVKTIIREVRIATKLSNNECKEKAIDAITKLNQLISQIKGKQCTEVRLKIKEPDNCIPSDVIQDFLPRFELAHEVIQDFFQEDTNSNLVPDICEKEKTCSKPCGPILCCKEDQSCKIGDPCMGDPACTSIPSYECVPPDGDNITPLTKITSPAFENNGNVPVQYTCDGSNISPPLKIENPPSDAKSFALIVDDPDAPGGTFVHWVIFNIPAQTTSIPEDFLSTSILITNIKVGQNDFGETSYGGPCPPSGPAHRYIFTLYALDTTINLEDGITKKQLLDAMKDHILIQAKLTGLYGR